MVDLNYLYGESGIQIFEYLIYSIN